MATRREIERAKRFDHLPDGGEHARSEGCEAIDIAWPYDGLQCCSLDLVQEVDGRRVCWVHRKAIVPLQFIERPKRLVF